MSIILNEYYFVPCVVCVSIRFIEMYWNGKEDSPMIAESYKLTENCSWSRFCSYLELNITKCSHQRHATYSTFLNPFSLLFVKQNMCMSLLSRPKHGVGCNSKCLRISLASSFCSFTIVKIIISSTNLLLISHFFVVLIIITNYW